LDRALIQRKMGTCVETFYVKRDVWNMTTPTQLRNLANRLVVCEAASSKASGSVESTVPRVYEKLRMRLSALAGAAGFQSLAFRALAQTRSESPGLRLVEIAADGTLKGLGGAESPVDIDNDSAGGGGVVLIERLLDLLLIFLGEALTLNLISDLWPDAVLEDCISAKGKKA
jgi:hypothetical protein